MAKQQPPTEVGNVAHELEQAIQKILESTGRRKLIVAGPGAGKTTLFKTLLKRSPGDKKTRLALTFITNLRDDMEKALGELCKVSTLHGYCQGLLHTIPDLRNGLSEHFVCQPGMASLIKEDWQYLHKAEPPEFVKLMRNLHCGEELNFYIERANYYDAVDFDDSVYRTAAELKAHSACVPKYDLVLIDEYQDFNSMEADVIETLAGTSPIVVAGDDDQALYSQLRDANWEHIRALHRADEYEVFELPFCMRCPDVIVQAVRDVIVHARKAKKLEGRIDKSYRHFEPAKGKDSKRYPKIWLVDTSVQRNNANYFGRFIAEAIRSIPDEEIKEANEKGEPVVLIIGGIQYRRPIEAYLVEVGYEIPKVDATPDALSIERGLELLKNDPESNLGWRIVLRVRKKGLAIAAVREAKSKVRLVECIPKDFRERVLADAEKFQPEAIEPQDARVDDKEAQGLTIKLTSFEGAKGLSAQHVFIVGMHTGDLPRDPEDIQDLEICKFLVGLTRTKKRCALLLTRRFGQDSKDPSVFLEWINEERFEQISIDAKYWDKRCGVSRKT